MELSDEIPGLKTIRNADGKIVGYDEPAFFPEPIDPSKQQLTVPILATPRGFKEKHSD